MKDYPYLESILHTSIVKDFIRGPRRYFPLPKENPEQIREAFRIIHCGAEPQDDLEVAFSIFFDSIDKYVETFEDGSVWVRTIYKSL